MLYQKRGLMMLASSSHKSGCLAKGSVQLWRSPLQNATTATAMGPKTTIYGFYLNSRYLTGGKGRTCNDSEISPRQHVVLAYVTDQATDGLEKAQERLRREGVGL